MANYEHLKILYRGTLAWNKWREDHPDIVPDLNIADLWKADLQAVDLSKADLSGANLSGANLTNANLNEANLTAVDLTGALLLHTNLIRANLSGCSIYGISVWDVQLEGATQKDLIITQEAQPLITVDNLEVAQFIYLLLHNEKLRTIIDTLTTKSVLILGRFAEERKAVLDAIRDELRWRNYIPILFDFEKPANRDLTETVMTLASLSRFVIADLSDPHSIPHELMSFAEKLLSVPVKPLFCPTPEHPKPYPMLEHLQRYQHVLPTYFYDTEENLITALSEAVIQPAEDRANIMRPGGIL